MKKISILVLLLISFITINVVKAEPYSKVFETEGIENDSPFSNHIDYKNGYITTDYTQEGSIINYYDREGKLLKTNELESKTVVETLADNDDLYLLIVMMNTPQYKVYKLNENLEIIDEITLENVNVETSSNAMKAKIDGYSLMSNVGKEIAIMGFANGIITVNKETKIVDLVTSQNAMKKYFPAFHYTNIINNDGAVDYKDGHIAFFDYESCSSDVDESPVPGVISLLKPKEDKLCNSYYLAYGDEDDIEWSISLDYAPTEVKILNGFIAVVEESINYDLIEIFDLEGKLVQTINASKNNYIYSLRPTTSGFIYSEITCTTLSGKAKKQAAERECELIHKVYTGEHKIKVNVAQGKGKVNIVESAIPGEPVTFTIEPEEGYTLSVVKAKDADGNVLEFHDYTFTMPSSDVELEVMFVRNALNPETMDIAIVSIFFAALLAGVLFFVNSKKLNWLK